MTINNATAMLGKSASVGMMIILQRNRLDVLWSWNCDIYVTKITRMGEIVKKAELTALFSVCVPAVGAQGQAGDTVGHKKDDR